MTVTLSSQARKPRAMMLNYCARSARSAAPSGPTPYSPDCEPEQTVLF
jgi:hypothetical protein